MQALAHPILRHLVTSGRLSVDTAVALERSAREENEPLVVLVVRRGGIEPESWAQAAAQLLGVPRLSAEDLPVAPVLTEKISARFLRRMRAAPIGFDDSRVQVAIADPADAATLKAIALATQREAVPVVVALDELEAALARWFAQGPDAIRHLVGDLDAHKGEERDELERLIDSAREAPVVRLVNQILSDALALGASDIHLEPFRDRLQVRFRVHGRLREIVSPPARYAAAIVSRIKILAKLDIAERRLPQDGRARLELNGRTVDLRVATAPSVHGETLVIRLLEADRQRVSLSEIGLAPPLVTRLERILSSPHGMVLVTGPTGSGKTTTLYAALQRLDRSALKVISVEDPVEYQIEGVTQIQVRPEIGLDFARVLRSVVRHDPDVIMVGETRDPETADISVHAALTGHLVLSTLHTNSAAGAIARLLDMGIEPYLLASVLRAVVGQRLVGLLCPHCREAYRPQEVEGALLARAKLALIEPQLFRARGCPRCSGLGIVGRIGIFELLEVDDRIRELIRARASTQEVHEAAIAAGMQTMFEDGIGKALSGLTSLSEVARVTEDW